MALAAAVTGLLIALMRIRTDSIDDLTREYELLRVGDKAPIAAAETFPGPVPVTIRDYVWSRITGDRRAAEQYSVKRRGAFVRNHALVVGYDRRNRIVYKALGST